MTFHSEIVTYLVLVPFICIFGIVGNILTLAVLIWGKFSGGAFVYLKGLAVFDILSLVFILPISLVRCPVCPFNNKHALNFYQAYIYICVGDVFLKASVWTTVLLTIERCLVIVFCRKIQVSRRKSRFPVIALVGIFILTSLENLPTVYAFTIHTVTGRVTLTHFGKSSGFEIYSWCDAVMFQFVPSAVLFVFNIVLAVYLVKHRRVSERLKDSMPQSLQEYRFTAERRTLLMLLGIIGLFLVTMVPCSVMNLIGISVDYGSDLYKQFQMAVTVLISLNFSCNFLLYCVLNRRFWQVLKTLLCTCCGKQNRVVPLFQSSLKESASEPAQSETVLNVNGAVDYQRKSGVKTMVRIPEEPEEQVCCDSAGDSVVSDVNGAVDLQQNSGVKTLVPIPEEESEEQACSDSASDSVVLNVNGAMTLV